MTFTASADKGSREWVLPVVSVLFLAAFSLLVLVPSPPDEFRALLVVAIAGSWLALLVSFVVRLVRAPRGAREHFVRAHRHDLAAAIFPLLGAFAPLRRLHTLRGFRGHGGNALRSRLGVRAGLYAATFVYVL